ncbi:MAG: glycosyltransferase [Methylophilaceae bacterium 17-44-8]|jgi:N-acetylglucosaminyldiphosphoundecaprenol N-acetyl-beta-D-mannosaminyltransferase|nr:MAG: glycosyltransferase [Methylophilales bacterium 28-44-11]OZA06922.1 MAG: glycosyltransferase [Methylophilaceae bacterium 17-44-8]
MNKKIRLFNIDIDQLTMKETVEKISLWVLSDALQNHYVVTPNVDHIVNLHSNTKFKHAYTGASLVVADGRPVVLASRLLGKPLPEVVPGSDLVPAIFDYFQYEKKQPLRVFLLGAMPGVAEKALTNIHEKWPLVNVVGIFSPDFGFEKSAEASQTICQLVSEAKADVVVFGVGAPKQELWSKQYAQQLNTKVILCVGATIDFLAGEKARAPMWVRKIGMEWLHRLMTEPKRLAKRYLVDAFIFPVLVFKEWRTRFQ